MGIETAIIIAAVAGTTAAIVSAQSKPGSPDFPSIGLTEEEAQDVTDTGTSPGRRAALVSGVPQGVLSPGTTNRSRLLGNL